jgi:hypothetical protein
MPPLLFIVSLLPAALMGFVVHKKRKTQVTLRPAEIVFLKKKTRVRILTAKFGRKQ